MIDSRLTPIIITWIVIAFISFAASLLTLLLMFLEIRAHPPALNYPMVRAMKRHDIISEFIRATAQVIAITIGIFYILGDVESVSLGWVFVSMNAAIGFNSVNGLVQALRLLGGFPIAQK